MPIQSYDAKEKEEMINNSINAYMYVCTNAFMHDVYPKVYANVFEHVQVP
jgi:hypothetical protein